MAHERTGSAHHPIRTELYTPEELFEGYEPDQPGSWVVTPELSFAATSSAGAARRPRTLTRE